MVLNIGVITLDFNGAAEIRTRTSIIAVVGMTGFKPATIDRRTDNVRRVSFLAIATPIKHICLQMNPGYS